jgi:hypothetical protein
MDLNRPPVDEFPISFSLGDIRFVCRAKASARGALVRRYGEGGYSVILASREPFITVTASQSRVVIFILI